MIYLFKKCLFSMAHSWSREDRVKMHSKVKLRNDTTSSSLKKRVHVTPDHGNLGLKFCILVTMSEFKKVITHLKLDNKEIFS